MRRRQVALQASLLDLASHCGLMGRPYRWDWPTMSNAAACVACRRLLIHVDFGGGA